MFANNIFEAGIGHQLMITSQSVSMTPVSTSVLQELSFHIMFLQIYSIFDRLKFVQGFRWSLL